MNPPICEIHNVPFKGPNSKNNWWHLVDYAKKEYCNKAAADIPLNAMPQGATTPQKPVEVREPIIEPKVDWESKDRQSLAQTAMKSASEIVAAMISVNAISDLEMSMEQRVKNMANEFYKELLKMKAILPTGQKED